MKDILYQTTIKGFPLIKFQSKEIIEKTIRGSFYMNSLRYYRELYEKEGDEFIGDPCEGKIFISKSLGVKFSIPEKGIYFQDLNDVAISTSHENDFVFCMFGINPDIYNNFEFTEEQRNKIQDKYDSALVITDIYEYCKRIMQGAESKKIEIKSGFVKYYDEHIDSPNLLISLRKGIENVVFYKKKKYSTQHEFRFTSPNPQNAMSLELDIGDIRDISVQQSSKDVLKAIMSKETV